MKQIRKRISAAALLSICLLLAATCKEVSIDGVKKAEVNRPFTLSVHEKAVFSENGLSLEISEINDSRCPVNVHCIWAGNAKIKLKVTGTDQANTGFELCLGQCDQGFQEADSVLFQRKSQVFTLILTKVDPYPGTGDQTKTAGMILKKN